MRLFQGQRQPVEALAFAPDGRHLAAVDGAGVSIFDVASGRKRRIPHSQGRPHLLAFLPSGRLVVAAGSDMRVYLAPTEDGGFVGFFPDQVSSEPSCLVVCPDGARLYAVDDTVRAWDMTGHLPRRAWVTRPRPTPGRAAVSPDGHWLAVSDTGGALDLYATIDGRYQGRLCADLFHPPGPLAWASDGRTIAGITGPRLVVLPRQDDGAPLVAHCGGRRHFTALTFHPSCRWVLAGCSDGTVRLYEPATAREVKSFAWEIGKARSVACSPDGMLAAAGGDRGQVVVWDVDE
jgi:WD40 repeat protein